MMDAKSRYSNGRIARHITCTSEVEEREPCAWRSCRRRADHGTQDIFACAEPCHPLSLSYLSVLSLHLNTLKKYLLKYGQRLVIVHIGL